MTKQKIIRTPTRAEGGVTPTELEAMAEHSKLWIKRALRTEPVDHDEIKSAVVDLYAAAGLAAPIVVVVPSPLVMAFSYGAAAAIWHGQHSNATDNATDNATRNACLLYTSDAADE